MIKFFLLHPAGGSSLTLKEIQNYLKKTGNESIAIDLPGHGELIGEDFFYEFDLAVGFISRRIKNELNIDDKYSIIGHSMGGILAYAVEHRLERNYGLYANNVIVMASNPPNKHAGEFIENPKEISDKELVNKVSELGGLPEEILKSESSLRILCPMLRADFSLLSTYIPREKEGNRIVAKIVVMLGNEDFLINKDEIKKWQYFTENGCEIMYFKGGHFFYQNECELVCKKILEVNNFK